MEEQQPFIRCQQSALKLNCTTARLEALAVEASNLMHLAFSTIGIDFWAKEINKGQNRKFIAKYRVRDRR